MVDRRFIEEYFPLEEVSKESSKEKSIRHGHISTFHLWWARRPLASSRTTIYASLIPVPTSDKKIEDYKNTIIELSKWKNSLNKAVINKAKKHIHESNKHIPRVLDPFSGGCTIPLESLRLGCETYASDYNPIASLIAKATIEIPFREREREGAHQDKSNVLTSQISNELISDIKKWSKYVFEEVKNEINCFFPNEKNGDSVVGYLWSHSIPCPNPRCRKTIPLIKQFYLANNQDRKIALCPKIVNDEIRFKIVGENKTKMPKDFDPKKGTISNGIATCMICGYSVDPKKVKEFFAERKNRDVLNCVVIKPRNKSGKRYRITEKKDVEIFVKAQLKLREKQDTLRKKFGISPIPDELTPAGKGSGAERAFSLRLYNMNTWGDLFNDRQKMVLLVFSEKIVDAYKKIEKETNTKRAKEIVLYLAILFDRLVVKNSNLVFYNTRDEKINQVFARAALGMVWDYVELNPFTKVGWENMENWVLRVLEHLTSIESKGGSVRHSSATALPFSDEFFDAVITDPPYYDNIPYSHLSDFFYVWQKRILGNYFPDLFSTPLTPKSDEIVAYSDGPNGYRGGKQFFEKMLKKSFHEIYRVLKPDGIAVIVYAHKSTEGWETLINSLLDSGLVITASWPLHTERTARLRSQKSASLASSIYMVARKWNKRPYGFYRDVKKTLKNYLNKKLGQLWDEGISGADFFIASIGSAIEVFGKYEKVIDDTDNQISAIKLLDDTREIVTNYAIKQVLHSDFSDEISRMTRFYVLWRWAYGEAKVPFDDALRMAQSVGIDIEKEWNRGFIVKEAKDIGVMGPDGRSPNELEKSHELIDVLHHVLILWKNKEKEKLDKLLKERGLDKSDMFKRVGQAISESLQQESTEKKWLDGFLTGFRVDNSQIESQTKLF